MNESTKGSAKAGRDARSFFSVIEAEHFEGALCNAVSIGGDTDTIAYIAGDLAEALHGLPEDVAEQAKTYLTDDLIWVKPAMGAGP